MIDDKDDKDKVLLTGDSRMGKAEHDALTQAPFIEITVDQLMELAKLAKERKLEFDVIACAGMTMQRAMRIKKLRVTHSWRALAFAVAMEWGAEAMWYPATNQLVGMALCECAATMLKEDYEKFPWQSRQ